MLEKEEQLVEQTARDVKQKGASSKKGRAPVSKQEQERRNAAAEAERIAWEQADAVAYKLVLEEEIQKEREAANKGASPKKKK